MDIYRILLFAILLNGLISYGFNPHRFKKWFVVSSFALIILVAALRGPEIGRDLAGHYASNFELIARANWSELYKFVNIGYDYGFVIFCKLISYISGSSQCFIVATSVITFFSIGRYIYKYSEDVILETFLLITSFLMFMYMTMIAQVLAIAIILWGLDYLRKGDWKKYILFVVLASLIHSSAVVTLLFIPLYSFSVKKKYVAAYIAILSLVMFFFEDIINIVVSYILPQFQFYFQSGALHNSAETIVGYELRHVLIYCMCSGFGFVSFYILNAKKTEENMIANYEARGVNFLNTNFLLYASLTSIVCRLMVIHGGVVKRVGYFFFPFAFTLLCRALGRFDVRTRTIIKIILYVAFTIFFFKFEAGPGKNSYGVYPYEFFWS